MDQRPDVERPPGRRDVRLAAVVVPSLRDRLALASRSGQLSGKGMSYPARARNCVDVGAEEDEVDDDEDDVRRGVKRPNDGHIKSEDISLDDVRDISTVRNGFDLTVERSTAKLLTKSLVWYWFFDTWNEYQPANTT